MSDLPNVREGQLMGPNNCRQHFNIEKILMRSPRVYEDKISRAHNPWRLFLLVMFDQPVSA